MNSWTRGIGRNAAVSSPTRILRSSGCLGVSGDGGAEALARVVCASAIPGAVAVRPAAALALDGAVFLVLRVAVVLVVLAALFSVTAVFFFGLGFFYIEAILGRE
jgi:hypothetical protein